MSQVSAILAQTAIVEPSRLTTLMDGLGGLILRVSMAAQGRNECRLPMLAIACFGEHCRGLVEQPEKTGAIRPSMGTTGHILARIAQSG